MSYKWTLSDSVSIQMVENNQMRLSGPTGSGFRLTADEAEALRLWLDDHVQTKNVFV